MLLEKVTYAIDFGTNKEGQHWKVINDRVMGGLSLSSIVLHDESLVFKGMLSLENNGGFSLVRSPVKLIDLSHFSFVRLRFRSFGRSFAIRMAISERYDHPNFKHYFSSTTNAWEEVVLKLTDFEEFRLGEKTGKTMTYEDLKKIITIGIIINDNKQGPFKIEIDRIAFY